MPPGKEEKKYQKRLFHFSALGWKPYLVKLLLIKLKSSVHVFSVFMCAYV